MTPSSTDTDRPHSDSQSSTPASLMRGEAQNSSAEAEKAVPAPKKALSTPQMLQLMRLEMDRAQRHEYPISCIVIGLDGYDGPDDGVIRKGLMPAIFHELKLATFANDVRGLGTWSPTFQFAVFPHVEPDALVSVATDLIDRARDLSIEYQGETLTTTISVGVAHNMQSRSMQFEDFLDDAERGMRLAQSRGGDRCEMYTGVEETVDNIKEELHAQAQEIRQQQQSYFEDKASLEEKWGRDLIEKVITTFHGEADISEATMRLEQNVLKVVSSEVESLKESSALRALAESQQQIDNLERRVAKLTTSLDVTEKELQRVASMKNVDTGVASVYRSVQGLGDGEDSEQKRGMLQDLFDANVAFRQELAEKKN